MEKQQFYTYLFGQPISELKEILAQAHRHEKNLEELHRASLLAACPTASASSAAAQKASIPETSVQAPGEFEMAPSDGDLPQPNASRKRKFGESKSKNSSPRADDSLEGYWVPLVELDEKFLFDWDALKKAHASGSLPSFCDFPAVVKLLQLVNKNWRCFNEVFPFAIYTRNPEFSLNHIEFFVEGVDYFVGAAALVTFVCTQACLVGDSALVKDAIRLLDPPMPRTAPTSASATPRDVAGAPGLESRSGGVGVNFWSPIRRAFPLGDAIGDSNSPPYSPFADASSDDEL